MDHFTPFSALIGGGLIGIAMILLFWFNGRIAGISGLIGGLFSRNTDDKSWRILFLAGLVLSGFIYHLYDPGIYSGMPVTSTPVLILGGFLVGFGTRMGNGCTSGHGLFGIARFSKRSIVATLLFISSAMVTVYLVQHMFGASL
ncbi:MAG: YeeE/YedE family protein [Methylococcales bacterium]